MMLATKRVCRIALPALLLIGLFLALAAPAMASGAGGFGDVSGSAWYYSAVDFVTQRGLFQGTSPGVFSPDGGMTRAMFITVLGRFAGVDAASWCTGAYHTFSDVSMSSYYAGYAIWAYEKGIVEGDGSSSVFSPAKNVTREQVCTILARFASVMGASMSSSAASAGFTDDGTISGWARDSVYALSRAGVIQGRDTGAFDPKGCATRAEAAAIIQRFDASVGGFKAPAGQQSGNTAPPADSEQAPPSTEDTPPADTEDTPPAGTESAPPSQPPAGQQPEAGGVLANASSVSHLSQGDRPSCLATSFSMAANLILGWDKYGPFDWTPDPAGNGYTLSVPSGTCFQGTDGKTYYPTWGGSTADSLRAAIDSALASGCPVIASVQNGYTASTHYVLVIGWADAGHSEYRIVDPSGGGEGMLDSSMPMSEKHYTLGNRDGTFACISFLP